MGKRIIQQARGKGSSTYRVKKKAFKYKLSYPKDLGGEGKVIKLLNSSAHSAPLAKILVNKKTFYIPAFKNMFEGQKIKLDGKSVEEGSILKLHNIPVKTKVYCIESHPNDGGKLVKSGGSFAEISKKVGSEVYILLSSKKEKKLSGNCRAIVGVVAGEGRLDKPIVKAGKMHHIKKSKSKLWPRTSALKMNAIDHPFGSGRGKVPKPKIAKRNSAPGQKVGLLRPKRTGKHK